MRDCGSQIQVNPQRGTLQAFTPTTAMRFFCELQRLRLADPRATSRRCSVRRTCVGDCSILRTFLLVGFQT